MRASVVVMLASLGLRALSSSARTVYDLTTPSIVLDKIVALKNCENMRTRAFENNCELRPHVKTHKTLEGALMQTGGRRSGITCSTLAEVEFFAAQNFSDILYGVPIDSSKVKRAAAVGYKLHVMVDNEQQLDALLEEEGANWSIVVMVDCGYGRDGVDVNSAEGVALVRRIVKDDRLKLKSLYTHGGHSYDVPYGSLKDIVKVAEQERDFVANFAARCRAEIANIGVFDTGVGSTPTASHPPPHLDGISEMHPGNYFVYDFNQHLIGSCKREEIGVKVLTRVVGHYKKTNKLQIDCGWTGCSQQGKEYGFGAIEKWGGGGSGDLVIENLKQEAGTVGSKSGKPIDFDKYPVGSLLYILPWHSCAAVHQHRKINVVEGGDEVTEEWKVVDGW